MPSSSSSSVQYFTELLNNKWSQKKKWSGPMQYQDPSGDLMMLPADMALIQAGQAATLLRRGCPGLIHRASVPWQDRKFKRIVQEYAKDQDKFFSDFARAWTKLMELGVGFPAAAAAAKA